MILAEGSIWLKNGISKNSFIFWDIMLYPVTGQVGRARGSHGNQCGVSENGS
jgi:hypothetical protein